MLTTVAQKAPVTSVRSKNSRASTGPTSTAYCPAVTWRPEGSRRRLVDAVFDTSGAGVLAGLAATGHLVVPIWRSYPLAEAARAHADLEAGRDQGKIVLLP